VYECCTCLPGGCSIFCIHAEQDDFQMRVGALQQATGFRGRGAIQSPIEEQEVGCSIRQGADEGLNAIHFYDFSFSKLAPE